MAKNKKRKTNEFQKQKLSHIHYKKEFIARLKEVINIVTCKNLSKFIPDDLYELVFENRFTQIKVLADSQHIIPSEVRNEIADKLSFFMKDITLSVNKYNNTLSISEYNTIGNSIRLLAANINPEDFNGARIIRDELNVFCRDFEIFSDYFMKMQCALLTMGFMFTDFGKHYYYLQYKRVNGDHIDGKTYNYAIIYYQKAEIKHIIIDNINRPVIRLGYCFSVFDGLEWVKINQSLINKNLSDGIIDVYIQSHALIRLKERLDCIHEKYIILALHLSFKEPKIYTDPNGKVFIEFDLFGVKTGYLLVEIIDNKLIIKTFLFITNNGTPEAKLLEENTGLKKLDKKYFALDKISTFMNSDIGQNEEVIKILSQNGCQCLIELYDKHKNLLTEEFNSDNIFKMLGFINENKSFKNELIEFENINTQ